MSFEVYVPTHGPKQIMPRGVCSIDKCGMMRIHTDDLREVHIAERFVVLVDRATRRIALREAADAGEKAIARAVADDKRVQAFSIRAVLREIGVQHPTQPVRRELTIKDNLVIIDCATWVGLSDGENGRRSATKRKPGP